MDQGVAVRDIIIIGAGPGGLSAAKLLKDSGLSPLLVEQGPVGNSWIRRPESMRLLSHRDWTSLPGLPITSLDYYPSKAEFLNYLLTYQKVFNLEVNTFEKVMAVRRKGDSWAVETIETLTGLQRNYIAKYVVVATGIFDNPVKLNIEGEDLPHVQHHYSSAYYYAGKNVTIVGGGNSAVEAALDLINVGINVSIMIKEEKFRFHSETKDLDDIREGSESRFKEMIGEKRINALVGCHINKITREKVYYTSQGQKWSLPSDFVLILVGYCVDYNLIRKIGLGVAEDGTLIHDPETLETTQRGIYAVGPLVGGKYIHKFRDHGLKILKSIAREKARAD